MKKIFQFIGIISIVLFSTSTIFAQGESRLKFSACYQAKNATEGEIIITTKIEKDFHVFAFTPGGDGSQIPTALTFPKTAGVEFIGKPKEQGKLISKYEDAIEATINYYLNEVKYVQTVKVTKPTKLAASIYYQVCNEGMCERPCTVKISIDLTQTCDGKKVVATIPTKIDSAKPATVAVKDSLANRKTTSVIPAVTIDSPKINLPENTASVTPSTTGQKTYGMYGTPVGDCGEVAKKELSPWMAFIFGLLGGFAALFFPCTLPMIPMTISFFLKGSGDKKQGVRNGILYGFFIFLVYFLLSLPFLFLNWGGGVLNDFATNPWVNLVFFAIFIVFAISLLGFFDISLPSFLVNKVDAKSNTQSPIGIFFMALTLAIVSFSCTGPILGLVLGNISNSKLITPAMSGFGIGLGVPFALFAMFPNLLKALPKSGGWLTTLKVVFAFLEIAFALKFLSNTDLVLQLGLLKRELFLGIWILICILTGLYLLGKFEIKKGTRNVPNQITNILAIICFAFAGYIGLDFLGKDINLFGFPPPKFYSYFYKQEKLKNGTEARTHTLNGMAIYLFLEDAMAEAKKQNKPVMIDFTGWACVNCRKMEENVWTNPKIYETLKNKYIIASLYVDDKRELPANEQFASTYLKATASTVGDKWFDLSLRHFSNAGQPFYALIDPNTTRILNTPKPFTPGIKEYDDFLQCGLTNFASLQK